MKRGISATGRGSPPLPRQRAALRVVQLTMLAVSGVLGSFALGAWRGFREDPPASILDSSGPALSEAGGLTVAALAFLVLAVWMGFRTVRGPRPPSLD